MLRIYDLLLPAVLAISAFGCAGEKNELQKKAAHHGGRSGTVADFLIYNGYGIDTTGTDALVEIIQSKGLTQRVVTEEEFNPMTADEFAQYGTFIWPGGYNSEIDEELSPSARRELRKAVIQKGLNFVGICAGAFLAVGPKTDVDDVPAWGLALIEGNYLQNYTTSSGRREAMVPTSFPDGSMRQLMLWSGPFFDLNAQKTNAQVIARYAEDSKPAMIQAKVNNSLVVLSGPHPEAPQLWQTESGLVDVDGLDWEIAWKLINAAHTGQPLPSW